MNEINLNDLGFSTQEIHGGYEANSKKAASVPIYQTSTFLFDSAQDGGKIFSGEKEGYRYSRFGNPTNTALENKMSLLEGAEDCVSTSSGISAISSVLWVALQTGDHVIACKTLYGDTSAMLNYGFKKMGIEIDFVDMSDKENVRKFMKKNTKVVYIETPANPTLVLSDIDSIAQVAHINKECMVIVDNTFSTPYIQRPLQLGADAVVYSGTKFLNGHGDVIAGFVLGKREFVKQVRFCVQKMTGAILSPFDAYLVIRGLKTLSLRMERHCANALRIAEYLYKHPQVQTVYYPGLENFQQYELAKLQMKLPGAIIAFELKGGYDSGVTLMNNLKICHLAVSLGDAETLIQHPASMSHAICTKEERQAAGVTEGLVRLAVGLECVEDIILDIDNALQLI